MILLGIDFETTGLDLVNDRITEVGLVLWDTDVQQPVQISGFLVNTDKEITEEITKLTGINRPMLNRFGKSEDAAFRAIVNLVYQADAVVAHNGNEFDKVLLVNWDVRRADKSLVRLPDKLWVDTKTDLPAEAYGKSASLKYMACDHGFLYDAHRAVSDVLAMFKIISKYDINWIVESAQTPTLHVRALVTFDTNKLAKDRGYHWKPEQKMWVKPIKMNLLEKEKSEAGFEIRVLETASV